MDGKQQTPGEAVGRPLGDTEPPPGGGTKDRVRRRALRVQFGGGGTGEGNGREASLARCGLQGHVRSLGAGVSGGQPEGG